MLRLFKSNDPYLLVAVFGILLLVRLGGWLHGLPMTDFELKWLLVGERLGQGFKMYSEAYDYTAPLSAYTYKLFHVIGGRSRLLLQVIATLLLFLQASQFNILLLRNNAFPENNYLPAFFYVLLGSTFPDAYVLSPALLSMTFVLLALNNIFRRIDNVVRDEIFLNSGLYLGISTLFYLPAVVFFVFFLASLLLFSSPAPRRILLFFYGLLMPIVICFGYFYWTMDQWYFLDSYFRGILSDTSVTVGFQRFWQYASLPAVLFMLSLGTILLKGRYTNYQNKILRVMVLMVLAACLVVFVDVELGPHQMILFVPSLSYLMAHYMLILRRKIFRAFLPYLVVVVLLAFPYYSYTLDPNRKEWSQSLTQVASLMYLGDTRQIYLDHTLASPFLDKKLSSHWLGKLDYYQPASKVLITISESNPDIIIDDWGAVDKIFHRFPEFEAKYYQEGDRFVKLP